MKLNKSALIQYLDKNISIENTHTRKGDNAIVSEIDGFKFEIKLSEIRCIKNKVEYFIHYSDSELDSLYHKALNLYTKEDVAKDLINTIRDYIIDELN